MAKKGSRPMPAAVKAQLAARRRGLGGNRRAATTTIGAGGFGHRTRNTLKEAFHRINWGLALLSGVAGYYLPSTATSLGLGWLAYDKIPGWSTVNDTLWGAVNSMGVPSDQNPWANGGLVGFGKTAGIGYVGKKFYDWQKGEKIGQGALNVGIPFALGLILDGPELSPMAPGGPSSGTGMGAMLSQGGVSW